MPQQEHLITVEALRKTGRPIGKVDNAQLEAYIEEVEQMYVKPTLGEELFLTLLFETYDKTDERYDILLNGGCYRGAERVDPCSCESPIIDDYGNEVDGNEHDVSQDTHYLTGLRTAMSYFVYAQNIMTGDFQSTRYGMVVKENEYSNHLSSKDRSDAYNNALEVANNYLRECVAYAKNVGLLKASIRAYNSGSLRIRKIG